MGGLIIVAFHQYWRSAAAIIVSVLGWVMVARGVFLLVAPQVYDSAGSAMQGAVPLVRAIFVGLALAGLYLTYVGWIAAPSRPKSATVSPTWDRRNTAGD